MMKTRFWLVAGIALSSISFAQQVMAADVVAVKLDVKKVVVDSDGREVLQQADVAKPGDVLEYTAVYRNNAKKGIKNLEATLPLPPHTEYLPNTARSNDARAALGGDVYQTMPLKRKVKQADGKEVEQLIPYAEYRSLRWYPGELAAGQELKFSARVRVASNTIELASESLHATTEADRKDIAQPLPR